MMQESFKVRKTINCNRLLSSDKRKSSALIGVRILKEFDQGPV